MNVLLAFIIAFLFASPVLAADGDTCREGVDSCYQTPPATNALNGEKPPGITVVKLCDGKASAGAGAITCGPIYLPRGGVPFKAAVVRPLSGTSAAGCGYDDLKIYTFNTTSGVCSIAAGLETPLLGVLDDDGTSTPSGGVQQIIVIGHTPGPCLYAAGTATAGTCNASNTVNVVVDLYPDPTFK